MMKNVLTGTLAIGTLFTGVALQTEPAFSMTATRCSVTLPSISNNVSPLDPNPGLQAAGNVGTCNIGTVNNDNPLPGQVNADLMFGKSDWLFSAKDEGNQGDDLNFSGGTGGELNISSFIVALQNGGINFTDLMVVFKGGNGNNFNTNNYVGYLLNRQSLAANPSTAITWVSPFVNTQNGNLRNVSHVSLYYRAPDDGVPIPTPALLPGLVGLGVAALRKKKADIDSTTEEA